VFVPEIQAREAFSTLTGFAAETSAIRLGTGVVTLQSRTPTLTAMAAATLHDVSGGRCVVGIGSGTGKGAAGLRTPADGGMPGPVALVEEYARVVREALAGGGVESAPFGVSGFRLGLAFGGPPPPPVWLAALGDRMVSLAGRLVDGVLLNWCTPERVAAARRTLTEAAERAGRDPSSVTVAVYARGVLDVDGDAALAGLREMTGMYASFPAYARQFAAMGFAEEAPAAAAAHRSGRPDEVPEALVRALTVTGGRAEALERFDALHAAGADLVLWYPVAAGENPIESVRATILTAAPDRPAAAR
jgi:alkanesulfonate monooxygenase SsuD/methylene tetrahydromethanopterin reductase-like flavin-dependent oxidoreductase (luciferase family)